jgi:integrase
VRPRNVTATDDEIDQILSNAPAHLRLWLLLCSDLAIRSGTACRIGPEHYDRKAGTLTFTTKFHARQRLPVTEEIARELLKCDQQDQRSFVMQLWAGLRRRGRRPRGRTPTACTLNKEFAEFRRSIGITRKLTPHDLRRTSAVKLYEHTKDARDVQSFLGHASLQATVWYLDHDMRPISRHTLELIKGSRTPPPTEEKTA